MADHCSICDTRRPEGGTNHLILNKGELWIEFCSDCGSTELTNADTGEVKTVQELFDQAPVEIGRSQQENKP